MFYSQNFEHITDEDDALDRIADWFESKKEEAERRGWEIKAFSHSISKGSISVTCIASAIVFMGPK